MAERLERWTFNWEAPSSSRAPDASNFKLIRSWQSLVLILGHACKIANWFSSY